MRLHTVFFLLLQLTFELSSCTPYQVISGYTVELPCPSPQPHSTGATTTWIFNGKDISEQPPDGVRIEKNGLSLLISPATSANAGQYVCLVRENNIEITRIHDLKVIELLDITLKVNQGSDVYLPCYFPPSSQVKSNALWFKERIGQKTQLNPEDDTGDNKRISLLYPFDIDQTILIRATVIEDAGIYFCESADGERFSTIQVIVQVIPTEPPFSCDKFPRAWEPCQVENSRTEEPMLQESMAEFSMKLYSYLRQSNPSSNLFFSPISISGALYHLLLGARENTRKAIERAVCVPHDFHCVHFQMKKLREKLTDSLQMASQIYYNPQMNLTESFTNQSIQFYEAEPTRLLENSEDNTQIINSWVANKTKNKITHLVDFVPSSTQMILLNAVSFNGQWKVSFNVKPKKGHFIKLDGDMVKVPLIHDQRYLASMTHVTELKAQVLRLTLTDDNSLYILLPRTNKATDLQQLEVKMTDSAVRQMMEEIKTIPPQYIEVTLPQIKLDEQPDMNILIKKLGLSSLFEKPNLCGLNSENMLVLDDVRHRAFLALTEQGVDAGAVSTMSFSRTSPSFNALRPFVMLLWSDKANVPLFIGRVTNP